MTLKITPQGEGSPQTMWTARLAAAVLFVAILVSILLPRFTAYAPGVAGVMLATIFLAARRGRIKISYQGLGWIAGFAALALLSSLWALEPAQTFAKAIRATIVLLSGGILLAVTPSLALLRNGARAGRFSFQPLALLPLAYFAGACLLAIDQSFDMPLFHLLRLIPQDKQLHLDYENRCVIICTLLYFPMLSLLFCREIFPLARRPRNMLALLLTLPLLLILYKTQNQSSQLAFGLAAILALAFPYRFRAAWYVVAAGIMLAILLAPWLALWMFKTLPPLVVHAPFLGEGQGYAAERLEIWDYVSRYALQRPWCGFGMEATRFVTDFDNKQLYQKGTTILHPHNFAIQLWMEFGVIGALAGAALMGRMLWFISRRLPLAQQRFALPTLVACLSIGAMTYGLWQAWWLGLLLLITALTALAAHCRAAADAPR